MARIADYATLKTAIQTYLAYDDIGDMFDTWLGLAEAKFRRDIRIREMEAAESDFALVSASLYSLDSDPVVSNFGFNFLVINSAGVGLPPISLLDTDSVYLSGLEGTVGGVDTTDLNDKWWPVRSASVGSNHFNIDTPYGFVATGVESGGGDAGKFRRKNSDGVIDPAIVTGSVHDLPAGFLEIIDLYETGSSGGALEYLPPQKFYSLDVSRSGTGQPSLYTVLGDQLVFAPLSDSTSRGYTMNYFKEFTGLTSTATTNTLLTIAPDVYLWALLFEAQPYMTDSARTAEFSALYRNAVDGLHAADVRSRHRPRGQMRSDGVTSDGAFRI